MMEEAKKGRLKNHRIYRDRTLVEDPLAWTLPLEPTLNLGAAN